MDSAKAAVSSAAGAADDAFHVAEVVFESLSTGVGDAIFGLGHTTLKAFAAHNVVNFLQLARMNAEIAVTGIEELFELGKCKHIAHRKSADNAETHALVDERIQFEGGIGQ